MTGKRVDIALLFCLESETELKCQEISSSTLIPHTTTHAVRGRPSIKDVERLGNGSVSNSKKKQETDCQQSKMESSCSTFVHLVVNGVIFMIVFLILCGKISIQIVFFYI